MKYDVAIIGSGPAGLFAALELHRNGVRSIAVIDRLLMPAGGLINDGKLNFDWRIGIEMDEMQRTEAEIRELIDYVKEVFVAFPEIKQVTDPDNTPEIQDWAKIAMEHGVEFIAPEQWHYGTDNSKEMVKYIRGLIPSADFLLGHEVLEISPAGEGFSLALKQRENRSTLEAGKLIVAPGRQGAYWWKGQAQKLGIPSHFGRIDVGVRIEMNRKFYDPITNVVYDPKFKFVTKRHQNRVRTFCTNPGGRVRTENYGKFKLVNGDALAHSRTNNTNFALLNSVGLTRPFSDSTEFGRSIAYIFNLLGGGKPIMQRVGDFREGRRSKPETFHSRAYHFEECEPSFQAVPGDITLGFPARVMDNLWESLKRLDKMVPGVLHPSTILYAPEIKFFDTKYKTDKYLQTTCKGIYVAGDGTGKSRGIVGAAMTGVIAAQGILKK